MRTTRQVPDPAAVAWWLHTLKIYARADPLAVAAYTRRAPGSPPRPRPKPMPNPNRQPDERDGRDEYPHDHH